MGRLCVLIARGRTRPFCSALAGIGSPLRRMSESIGRGRRPVPPLRAILEAPVSRVGAVTPAGAFRPFLPTPRRPCRTYLPFPWGAQKRCPSGEPGHQGSGWNGRFYSRRCDVKKPQLTIGHSAPVTGEETRGSALREPCYASTNRRRVSYPAVCSKWVTLLGN